MVFFLVFFGIDAQGDIVFFWFSLLFSTFLFDERERERSRGTGGIFYFFFTEFYLVFTGLYLVFTGFFTG